MPIYYLTLFLIPFMKHPLVSYNFHGFTPIKVAGGLAFLVAIASLKNSPRKEFFHSESKKYFGLFVAFLCLSMAANGFDIGRDRIFWFISILIFYVTTVTLVNTRQRLFESCVVLMIAMDVASAYMVRHFLQYGSRYQGFRPGGIFGDPNFYAVSALGVLPIAYFLWGGTTNRWLARFCLATIGALLVGLTLSQSRGGMIGLAAVILATIHQSRSRIRTTAILCVVAILVAAFSPINPLARFAADTRGAQTSMDTRIATLYAGLKMAQDNPLFGVGLGNFKRSSVNYGLHVEQGKMAHNSFLELAADNGIPVLILFLLMCLAVMKDISRARYLHAEDPVTQSILVGIRIGLIGFLAAGIFLSAEYQKMFWILCFLTMASSRIEPIESPTENDDEFFDEELDQIIDEVVCQRT